MHTVFTRMSAPARKSASLEWAPLFDVKYLMSASCVLKRGAHSKKKVLGGGAYLGIIQ